MANPLHKNKVIQFIERYPNSDNFTLTTGNTPLSNGTTTTSFTPGCSVGLSNQAGNPANFNNLIDMWVAGGLVRNNINPFGLMRLWAATYRTYYHWCKSVKRPYSNPVSSTVVTQSKLLGTSDYKVNFTSNLNSGSINGTTLTGAFTQGKQGSAGTINGSSLGLKRVVSSNSADITLGAYIPPVLFDIADTSANSLISLPVGGIAALYGGPIKCELLFNNAVDIESILIPHSAIIAETTTPEAGLFNWFYPSNFKIRSSYDGINYTSPFEYNKIITALNQLVQTSTSPNKYYDWRQIISTSISSSNTSFITALNNISNYSSSVNSKDNLSTWYVGDTNPSSPTSPNQTTYGFPNDSNFPTKVKSIDYKSSSYDLSSFVISKALRGHEVEVVIINKGSTPRTCIVKTWFLQNSVTRYVNGSATYLIPLQYLTNALAPLNYGYFQVIDLNNIDGGIICYGTCESPISMKGVRSLELTSGIVDNTTLRPYIVSLPYVKGTIKSIVTQLNTGVSVNNNYIPTYTDAYWTTYSPEAFDIGNVTFSDTIASSAFGLLNFTGTNIDKWKVMPYTLPSSGIFLQSQIKSSAATVREVPTDFDYTEDYINNKIIPLPTADELIQFQIEADARGLDVSIYYFRVKFSIFLKELIDYCKSTCLKFWQYYGNLRSVSNFQTYTIDALQFDNSTLPIENVIAAGIKTYEVITSGNFDIESNIPAGRLWFLSGGDSSRIDVDIAVLQKLLDIAGITV
ncbi:hypothetical protein [Nostoc sp. NMS8]|uniref:hypothetical protein n=1 Tax=Nostoc sp. NMS8 TaxID=2815392 RepID=UPI0025F571F7|nr:hypothetical protein [Nostoc sp. NMS8]MBN3962248.1 hypothetical protein [Nostoc sp. NMS8]